MLWVGGGIILHGFEQLGYGAGAHLLHDFGKGAAAMAPVLGGFFGWLTEAIGAGLFGLAIGLLTIPVMGRVISPGWRMARQVIKR
jgi:predicted DNA repair protein MutK